jgi:hypothetical protein
MASLTKVLTLSFTPLLLSTICIQYT